MTKEEAILVRNLIDGMEEKCWGGTLYEGTECLGCYIVVDEGETQTHESDCLWHRVMEIINKALE
jgi:hypothetical protein